MTMPPRYPVPPGGMIGILGGGQLGRMLALAAAKLGVRSHIYSDAADAPAFDVAAKHTFARYDDEPSLAAFAGSVDAITFEFENVPSDTIAMLSREKPMHPGARALAVTQDRLAEKNFLSRIGVATTEYAALDPEKSGCGQADRIILPAVLKTRRFGYDGKGQWTIRNMAELQTVLPRLKGAPAILERWIDFSFECSVIAARGRDGTFAAFDPSANIHGEHILRRSSVPAPLTRTQSEQGKAVTARIAEALEYVGVLAVEFFVTREGALLVNEIAPRVHNSGHWTLEACLVSQFEQHVRAVAGWPLGDPSRHANAVMENLIGSEAEDWRTLARQSGALHLYGKKEIRPGRKMGHVTWISPLSDRSESHGDPDREYPTRTAVR
jgi:5-(carboxyamino)imidazole ribonucleotide synthase